MTTKEQILAEIERRKRRQGKSYYPAMMELLSILDILPDEPVEKTCKTCGFYENNCPFIRGKFIPYPSKVCKDYTFSTLKAEPVSEDERIRKEIIEVLRFVPSSMWEQAKTNYERCFSYLKKQKEQKWSPSEGEMGVLYKLCYISNQITDEDDTELTRLYQDLKREYFNGHSFENMFSNEKQKEPHYTKRNALFDKCVENCGPEIMKRVSDEVDEMLQKEQKPEDDKIFEEWIDDWWKHNKVNNPDSYNKGDEIQFDEKGFKNFCRGIRNMYQQKPAEWSAEDELMIKCCFRAIEHYKYTWKRNVFRPSQFDIDGYLTSPEKVQTWLESLRNRVGKESLQPHWKPTGEQMKALWSVWMGGDTPVMKALGSLLEDLKKLM